MNDPVYYTPRMIAGASGLDYHAVLTRIRNRAAEGLVPPCTPGRGQSLYTYEEVKTILRDPRRHPFQARSADPWTEDETQLRTELLRRQLINDGFNVR